MGETLCTLSSAVRLIGLLDYEREWLVPFLIQHQSSVGLPMGISALAAQKKDTLAASCGPTIPETPRPNKNLSRGTERVQGRRAA